MSKYPVVKQWIKDELPEYHENIEEFSGVKVTNKAGAPPVMHYYQMKKAACFQKGETQTDRLEGIPIEVLKDEIFRQ